MRQRKRDQEQRKKLGSLVPIDGPTLSNFEPVEVTRLREAVPLRSKRAETEVIGKPEIEARDTSAGTSVDVHLWRKSSMACSVRTGKSYDVNFGHVEVREYSDSQTSEISYANSTQSSGSSQTLEELIQFIEETKF